jgi:hypothetical protein
MIDSLVCRYMFLVACEAIVYEKSYTREYIIPDRSKSRIDVGIPLLRRSPYIVKIIFLSEESEFPKFILDVVGFLSYPTECRCLKHGGLPAYYVFSLYCTITI